MRRLPAATALALAALGLAGCPGGDAPAEVSASAGAPGLSASALDLTGRRTEGAAPFRLRAESARWDAPARRATLARAELELPGSGWRLAAPVARFDAGTQRVTLEGGGGGNTADGAQALEFEADQTVFEPEAGRVLLTGAVSLKLGALTLRCRKATLAVPKGGGPVQQLTAEGDVLLVRGTDTLAARSLSYDARTRRWTASGRAKARFTLPAGAPPPVF